MAEPDPLDALLQEWKAHVLGQAFELGAATPPQPCPGALSPSYWRVMRSVCSGGRWRRRADPAWIREVAGVA